MWKKDWTPESNDIIIPVMGPIGTGKSTFINFIAGEGAARVGHDLKSCTVKLLPVVIGSSKSASLNGRRLVLVDTPGFGGTYVDDAERLHCIGSWLKTMYNNKKTKLAGVIYLHDISLGRLSATKKSLDIFQNLCGGGALRNVVLCTTKWSDTCKEDGEMRAEQLAKVYWKEMIANGSTVHKFDDSRASAWEVVNLIIKANQEEMEALQIQKELVDAHKLIPETEAGRQLRYSPNQLLKILKQVSKWDSPLYEGLSAESNEMHTPFPGRRYVLEFLRSVQIAIMWKKERTPEDNDIIIPCVTIRNIARRGRLIFSIFQSNGPKWCREKHRKEVARVGDDLESCTAKFDPIVIDSSLSASLNGGRLILVDTPGFGDTYVDDAEILRRIGSWLETAYKNGTKLAGIIYLHDISLPRMMGTRWNDLHILQKLCGDRTGQNVVLCTTKWSDIVKEDGERRTQQLCDGFWQEMIAKGSTIHKFERSEESAWEVVNMIIKANRDK